jgi:hypothetical protein
MGYAIDSVQTHTTCKELNMSEQKNIEWIRASEAAEIMNVSLSNVYYLCKKEIIECRKWGNTWQVSKEDAENYERSNRNPDWLHQNDES